MKKRILETLIVILFAISMLLYAKDIEKKQIIEIIENQTIIKYKKPIGIYKEKTKTIIGEKRTPLEINYLEELNIITKTTSKQKYRIILKQPISLEILKNNNYYNTKINHSIEKYNDTFNEKYQEYLDKLEQEQKEQARLNALKSGFIKTQGSITLTNLELMYEQYNKIPQNVRTTFENNGWTLYLTTNKLGPIYYPGQNISIQGITDFSPKIIYIENRPKACLNATIHEIGHAIDSMVGKGTSFGFISYSNEFRIIFLEESSNFVEVGGNGNHARSSPMEYFAEAFNQTILYPESCKKHSPKTYEYIINVINDL